MDNKKMIVKIAPFKYEQDIYILEIESGKPVEHKTIPLEVLPKTVIQTALQYDILTIDILGAKHFSENIINKIRIEETNFVEKPFLIINNI